MRSIIFSIGLEILHVPCRPITYYYFTSIQFVPRGYGVIVIRSVLIRLLPYNLCLWYNS